MSAAERSARLAALPVLPTAGVGSYASPGWLFALRPLVRDGAMGELDAMLAGAREVRAAL